MITQEILDRPNTSEGGLGSQSQLSQPGNVNRFSLSSPGLATNENQLSLESICDFKNPQGEPENDSIEARPLSRAEYNRQYYLANREKISERRKERRLKLVGRLLGDGSTDRPRPCLKLVCIIQFLLFTCLAVIMTRYLIVESARFYQEGNESIFSAYIKAIMMELTGILFSFSAGKHRMVNWMQKVVMVFICGFALFTMSYRAIRSTVGDARTFQQVSAAIAQLEREESEKMRLREAMVQREWIGATRKYDQELKDVRRRHDLAVESLRQMDNPSVMFFDLGIMVIFRLLVVMSNIICFHRIVELVGSEAVRKMRSIRPDFAEPELNLS